MREAAARGPSYAACLRNVSAQAAHLAGRHENVHVLGADTRGEFRDEDQLCAARIAARLTERGYEPSDRATEEVLERLAGAPDDAFVEGRSATYLRRTGQEADLEFILAHIDDLPGVFSVAGDEVVAERGG
jgi:2-phosphosulfolactate phosphatase